MCGQGRTTGRRGGTPAATAATASNGPQRSGRAGCCRCYCHCYCQQPVAGVSEGCCLCYCLPAPAMLPGCCHLSILAAAISPSTAGSVGGRGEVLALSTGAGRLKMTAWPSSPPTVALRPSSCSPPALQLQPSSPSAAALEPSSCGL